MISDIFRNFFMVVRVLKSERKKTKNSLNGDASTQHYSCFNGWFNACITFCGNDRVTLYRNLCIYAP